MILSDLSFLYDPNHFSWLRRHVLNFRVKREIKAAARDGRKIQVLSEKVAEDLHKYYRVPVDSIEIKNLF